MSTATAPRPEPTVAPRWARRAATLAALTTVPSGIWRISMALGLPVGVDEQYRQEHYGFPGWGTVYVFALTLVLVSLALLTLGLVRPWGEVTPRWVPYVGGRRVPPLAAVIPAAAGALALTQLWVSAFSNLDDIFAVYGLEGTARVVVLACYAPLLLWGPLLGVVTVSYARRTLSRHGEPDGGGLRHPRTARRRIPSDTARHALGRDPRSDSRASLRRSLP